MLRVGRKLRDLWIYFKAGHGGYLVYTMSIMNFVVLQHRLLISYIPFLDQYLNRLSTFIIFFVLTYIPLAIVIGYYEFRKGEIKRRPMLNPYIQDSIEAQILISRGLNSFIEGNIEDARNQFVKSIDVLSKWKIK
jgi:hypothetical protein